MSNNYPISRQNNLVTQDLEIELLIYDLSNNKAFCLNETSAMIWQLCDGAKSIAEIAELMSNNLKIPVSEDLVRLAIGDLQKENLVEIESNQRFFEGKSRRDVIKKIGFVSMITLPVVSSLVAPRAVEAQSGCVGFGQACTTVNPNGNGSCCSNPNLRCAGGSCVNCLSNGTLVPGGCNPTTYRLCCSNVCALATNRCDT